MTLGGYFVIARTTITVANIWQYGTGTSFKNLALLVIICFALFLPFVMVGVIISTFFGRRTDGIGRLYFADLIGAGLACAIVVPMIRSRAAIAASAVAAVLALVLAGWPYKLGLMAASLGGIATGALVGRADARRKAA